MRVAVILFLVLLPLLADPITERTGPQIVTLPEAPCHSDLYQWDGQKLACHVADRARILRAQRNLNNASLKTCQEMVGKLNQQIALNMLYEEARRRCRQLGKDFSVLSADCVGVLPKKAESQ